MHKQEQNTEQTNQSRPKGKKRKYFNMDLPAFVMQDGTVITHAVGVKVPPSETNRPEERKANIEIALRKFKQNVNDSGVIDEYKSRKEFIKPSAKKRRQREQAIRVAQRESYLNNLRD